MALTKDQILAASDSGLIKVTVPEWPDNGKPGEVYIRVMTVGERDAYENEWVRCKQTGVEDFRTKFLARCLCDEKGNRLFGDEEIVVLSKKSAKPMMRLWQVAMDHNALTDSDVDELAKN
jgi:hypothetical protein